MLVYMIYTCSSEDETKKYFRVVEKSVVHVPIGYDIYSGIDLATRQVKGYTSLDVGDSDRIKLGYCSDGSVIYTSFTKKEYLDDLDSVTKVRKR